MGRTSGQQEQATTNAAEAAQSYKADQAAIGQYNQNLGKLNAGVNVGANPFQQTGYLSNVNKLQSEGLNTAANSGKAEMSRWSKATGGLNSSQVPLAQRDVTLQTGRTADTLSAERAAKDYQSNLAYQQYLAGAPLSAANAEGNLFNTATTGESNANTGLTDFWGGIIKGFQAGPCWIAAALYGENDWRTNLLRSWLKNEFSARWYGRLTVKVYMLVGERVAYVIRRFPRLGDIFRPLFDLGVRRARQERGC